MKVFYKTTATGERNYCVPAALQHPAHTAVEVLGNQCLGCPHLFNRRDWKYIQKGICLCNHPSPRVLCESEWREYIHNINRGE